MKRLIRAAALLVMAIPLAAPAGAQEVVAVVSTKSPVTALNSAQLADIFLGKTSRFPDGSLAVPIDQPEDSPVRERFYSQYTGKSPAQVRAHWSKIIFTGRGQPPKQVETGVAVKKAVADNPHAIGYIDPKLVDESVRVVALR